VKTQWFFQIEDRTICITVFPICDIARAKTNHLSTWKHWPYGLHWTRAYAAAALVERDIFHRESFFLLLSRL